MSADIATWLVQAKVSPPQLPLDGCRRTALLERLAADDSRVIVLDAPAGFGKTLLFSQFRELCLSQGRQVAWLSLDDTDAPDTLVPYLAFAFHQCGIDMLDTGLMSSSLGGDRTAHDLGRFLHRIESAGRECVLVLDDAERLQGEAIAEVVNPLLRIQPRNLKLCIAFRSNPGIGLSSLQVRNEVLTLLPADLRFTRSEINNWFGEKVDEPSLDTLLERTFGWPVALQLVRIGTDQARPLADQLSSFAWTGREPASYVREQVLAQLQPELRDFLRDTSILESVRADASDCVRGATDGQALMQRLHAALEGLFAPLEEGEAFRLHPLMREYLHDALKESDPERFARLNRAAAEWLWQHGQGLRAMRHALNGGSPELAATVFEEMGGCQLWLREGMARLNAALSLLDGHELAGFPRVQVARSLWFAKNGDMRRAREALQAAKAVSNGFLRDRRGGDDTALMIDGHFIDLLLTEYGCAPTADAMADDTWKVVMEYVQADPALHAYIMTWRCLFNLQSGRFEDALRHGQRALRDFEQGRSRYGELFIHLHFGTVELARGHPARALESFAKAVRIHREEVPDDAGVGMICNIALGEACWESGDDAAARRYLQQVAKKVRHAEAWFDLYMAAYFCSMRYLHREAGFDEAASFLKAATEHAVAQGLRRLTSFLRAAMLLLLSDSGRDDEALKHASRYGEVLDPALPPADSLTWRELEVVSLARARVALLTGRHDLAERQVAALNSVATATGNRRMGIRGQVLLAVVADAKDDRPAALEALRQAAGLALPGRYCRPFLDERRRIGDLLEVLAAETPEDPELAAFLTDLAGAAGGSHSPNGNLTPREIEIIAELARGRPDKVIARSVGLSAHGVRYHLKNIYSKLGVKSRIQAVSRARSLGLLR